MAKHHVSRRPLKGCWEIVNPEWTHLETEDAFQKALKYKKKHNLPKGSVKVIYGKPGAVIVTRKDSKCPDNAYTVIK